MTLTLEITEEVEATLRLKAAREGQDIAAYLHTLIEHEAHDIADTEPYAGSAADLFVGRVGLIHGSSEPLSQSTGERFTQYLLAKKEAGHL